MEAVAAVAGAEETMCGSRWIPATNWIVAAGSIQDAISFETSEEDASAPAVSTPLLLLRPPAQQEVDFLPCEVTISLNGKYELHRIYVRSTARVYEIYYATDKEDNSKEYLCTVRCGVADKEVTPLIPPDVASAECESGTTSEKQDKMSLADSNCSNEDGWIEVKVPDSPLHDHKTNAPSRQFDGNSNTDFQVYYEATADISDASPCTSVTLRFLSLHTKTCVHVSEIYVYADPVETPNPGTLVSTGEKFGGSSLLAMFMPSLLQLSKSGASKQDKVFDASGVHKYQDGVQKAAEIASSEMEIIVPQDTNSDMPDNMQGLHHEKIQLKPEYTLFTSNQRVTDQEGYRKLDQLHEPSETKLENVQLGSSQTIAEKEASSSITVQEAKARLENVQSTCSEKQIDLDQVSKSSAQENFITGNHIERVLDELVSRVTRIEAFCSRFEESLLKPLSCIETRLQKLETLFQTFSAGDQFPQQGACSRISAPEFSSDESESDAENKHSFKSSSASGDDAVLHDPSVPADVTEHPSILAAGSTASVHESRMYPGLVVKAPEFSNEDNECSKYDPSLASDANCNEGAKLSSIASKEDECIKNDDSLASDLSSSECKKLSSIDCALASALEAFLSSKTTPSMMEPYKLCSGDGSCFSPPPARNLSNGADSSVRILNEVEEEIAVGDSSLLVAAAPKMSVRNSDWDSGCGMLGMLEVSASFADSSLSAGILVSSLPSSPMDSGLIFKAPEFPNDEDEFSNCGDSSETNIDYLCEDQQCMPMDGDSVSDLVAFLSLRELKTSNVVTISSEPYNLDKNEISSFMVRVPYEGAEGLYSQKHENSIKGLVDFDLNVLPAKTGLECKCDRIEHCNCSVEVLLEGSSTIPLECCLEKRGEQVKLRQCCSNLATALEERLLTDDAFHNVGSRSNCSINNEWQGGLLIDSDDDLDGQNLNQLGKGCTGSSSPFSSVVTNSNENKDQVDWTSLSSMGLSADRYGGVAENENGSTHHNFTVITNDSTSNSNNPVGYGDEQAPNLASSCDDPILDVKFVPERDWKGGLPLEILLGETYDDAVVQDSGVLDVTKDRQLLDGMENLSFPADSSGTGDDGVESCLEVDANGSGFSKQQHFSSLI